MDRTPLLTTAQAAQYLGRSRKTIHRARARNKGPRYYKLGTAQKSLIRYRVGDLYGERDSVDAERDGSTLLTISQAAEYLGVSQYVLQKWRQRAEGPRYYRLGDNVQSFARYSREDLDEWRARWARQTDPDPMLDRETWTSYHLAVYLNLSMQAIYGWRKAEWGPPFHRTMMMVYSSNPYLREVITYRPAEIGEWLEQWLVVPASGMARHHARTGGKYICWSDADLSECLDVASDTLRRWRYLGIGPRYRRERGKFWYRPEDVMAWLEKRHVASIPEERAKDPSPSDLLPRE